jgi:hypothetical protein
MSHERKIIQEVWNTGNYFSPQALAICKVEEKDLPKLRLSDRVSQAALRSWQEISGIELDKHAYEYHGRAAIIDGIAGPATLETVEAGRDCHVRDYEDPDSPEGVMRALGTSGNWKECHGLRNFHAANCSITNQAPAHVRPHFGEVLRRCRAAYQDIGLQLYFGGPGSPIQDGKSGFQLTASFVGSSSGWIGLAQVATNRGCGTQLWSRYLSSYMRNSSSAEAIIRQWCVLFLHEWGHNCGSGHTRGGIMNPSILSLGATWRGDVAESWFRRMYGGVPVPTDPDGPDKPDPKPHDLQFRGAIEAVQNGIKIGEYQLVPKISIF